MTDFKQTFGMSRLNEVELEEHFSKIYEEGIASCPGEGIYLNRMKAEFREYLALAQVSRRIEHLGVCFEGTFQLHFLLRSPVPVKDEKGEVTILDWAHVHLAYPEEAMRKPAQGTDFVRLILPPRIFHPNVSPLGSGLLGQVLCLGPSLPAGIRLREILLMTEGAVSLKSINMDVFDPAGLLNPEAALWWQENRDMIPLSETPFIQP